MFYFVLTQLIFSSGYTCVPVLCCYGNCQFEETGLWVVVNSHGKFKSCGEALLESAV